MKMLQKMYSHKKLVTAILVGLFLVPIRFVHANFILETLGGTVFQTFSIITGVIADIIRNLLVLVAPMLDVLVRSSFNSEDLFADAPFVIIGWTLVRDFANILFILIFVVVAIGTILGIQAYSAKRLLPKLIGIALIVNFSRVIAGFMIDIAQSVMLYFLQFGILASDRNVSVVLALMNGMRLDMLTSVTIDAHNFGGTFGSFWEAIANRSPAELHLQDVIINIMTIIFMGAALGVFIWIAWTLIVRIVALWVLIIISPIAWVIGILPQGAGMVKSWWENFIKWNFVGISVGFFLFLSLLLLQSFNTLHFGSKFTDLKFNSDGKALTDEGKNQASFANLGAIEAFAVGQTGFLTSASPILMYATVITFLYFAVGASKKASVFGANVVVDKATNMYQDRAKRALMFTPNLIRNKSEEGIDKIREGVDRIRAIPHGGMKTEKGRQVLAQAAKRKAEREKKRDKFKLSHDQYAPDLLFHEAQDTTVDEDKRLSALTKLIDKGGYSKLKGPPPTTAQILRDYDLLRSTGEKKHGLKMWSKHAAVLSTADRAHPNTW